MVSHGYPKGPRHDNSYKNVGGEEKCREHAMEQNLNAWGYRNDKHPSKHWKDSCFLFNFHGKYSGNKNDKIHSSGCTYGGNMRSGCWKSEKDYQKADDHHEKWQDIHSKRAEKHVRASYNHAKAFCAESNKVCVANTSKLYNQHPSESRAVCKRSFDQCRHNASRQNQINHNVVRFMRHEVAEDNAEDRLDAIDERQEDMIRKSVSNLEREVDELEEDVDDLKDEVVSLQYTEHKKMDRPGGDIKCSSTWKDVDAIKKACDSNTKCIGWHTSGPTAGCVKHEGAGSLRPHRSVTYYAKKTDVDELKNNQAMQNLTPQQGFCVKNNNQDQNSGQVKLDSLDYKNEDSRSKCLAKCVKYANMTGCEMIWDQKNKGCYVHTQEVAKGNNVPKHVCYLPK